MKVYIPGPLRSYTRNQGEVEGVGSTVGEVLDSLESQYPGIRFRMIDEQGSVRPHIRFFINKEEARTTSVAVRASDEFQIICAVSGGAARS